ncbi:MAG: DNA polymerase III subunit alpha [Candidatus Latescibacteria bacterium]|nr:DNA polymerase III subunit alpha [Candidatus Latescibacterota bacterium]
MDNTCGFVHLHNHTMYSLLDGAIKPDDLIAYAKKWNMGAIAVTDHGNMFGAVEFYLKAQKAGIKPIIGSEIYVAIEGMSVKRAARSNNDGANHLVLLASTDQGYRNLMKIVSIGYLEGFYYRPRVDKDVLREYADGLIAMSACLGGEIPELINQGYPDLAEQAALEYVDIFGEGNFFLEIQDHGLDEEKKPFAGVAELSRKTGIPLIATNDAHYLKSEHADSHEVLLCISTGKTLDDKNRMSMSTDQLYLKSPDEMKALFSDHPEALENTVRIAERCNVEINTEMFHTVRFEVPLDFEGNTDDYLAHISEIGLRERYGEDAEKHRERMEYELGVIKKMGFSDYFLAIYDCTREAREMNIPVGPARGSAGGSIIAYAIGITNLDPIAYGLIFERFLNPERISMPDFDVDYADRDRGRMIEYVKKKYGEDHVCQIITFGKMKARLVIRDVGRVLNMPYSDVDAIAKLIPTDLNITLDKAFQFVPELRELEKKDDIHRELFRHARTLEGLNRHAGTHAAGVIITPRPCTEFFPLYKPTNEDITSQYSMEFVEKIGCLKVDFLGLRNLTVIKDTVDIINAGDNSVDIDGIPLDDPKVYELMGKGETTGVFQFESSGMRDYLRKLKPTCMEDLIAMNALYRPGPLGSNMVDDFIDRKHGRKKITYLHPTLEPILRETYGVIVYQEQVMKIANVMAGFTLGAADQLRRAMGKKKVEEMTQMKHQFIEGARAKDIPANTSNEVFDLMAHFAGYGFNKSHSAGYAILAYQTAWLKANYPSEFMAANLTSERENSDRIVILIEECKRAGITVLSPDINSSLAEFTVENTNVRFGLCGIKNVGRAGIEALIDARKENGPFRDIYDFCSNIELKSLKTRMIESLIMAGAMDCFGVHRLRLIAGIEQAVEFAQAVQREREMGQMNLFGESIVDSVGSDTPPLPDVKPWGKMELLAKEKEVLGFWFSGHPLEDYMDEMKAFSTSFNQLFTKRKGSTVTVGGVITSVTRKTSKKDNKPYIVLKIEDLVGSGEVLLTKDAYENYKDTVSEDSLVLAECSISKKDNGNGNQPGLFANSLEPLETAREKRTRSVNIKLSVDETELPNLDTVKKICENHPGKIPLRIKLKTATAGTFLVKTGLYKVSSEASFIDELRSLLGSENAWIS